MTDWTQGYVADIPYALGFYRETMPNHLAFAALCAGDHPGGALKSKRVLELGIGMGLGFVVGAAASPHIYYEGVDFNPLHVAHANGLIEAANLTNITVREASFQDVASEAQEGQHDIDVIVLHGILTWVSADAHVAIVEIARKRLKPGGVLYVSYNSMPGWAHVLPMQRLMRENAKRLASRSDLQTASGVELVKSLTAEGAVYFTANPSLAPRVDKLTTMNANYLAHEYLNANWFIFHFADVAEMFGRAKLGFLASATLAENIDSLSVPEKMRQRVIDAKDSIWKETLRDFATNKQFRRDIFARGHTSLTPAESMAFVDKVQFALATPRNKLTFKIGTALGELEGRADLYGPVAELLATKIASFGEIAALPAFTTAGGRGAALQTMALLVHTGQVLPIVTQIDVDRRPAQRLNRALVEHMLRGRTYNFLAAPNAGSGIPATNLDLLMFAAVISNSSDNTTTLANYVLGAMSRLGISPAEKGVPITEPGAQREAVNKSVDEFIGGILPVWQRLGVL